MGIPWKTLGPPDNGREYVALLSYLPLRAYRNIPLSFGFTSQIIASSERLLAQSAIR